MDELEMKKFIKSLTKYYKFCENRMSQYIIHFTKALSFGEPVNEHIIESHIRKDLRIDRSKFKLKVVN